ncbi:MAG: carbohydrate ABC transporter permease, partial [Lachnospiraceae bacterium]|nr:carbohydrate ABC transporter permease [Lachnospiraceae bacterium]
MRNNYKILRNLFLCTLALLLLLPLLFLISGSLMGKAELEEYLAPVLKTEEGYAVWRLIPLYPTLRGPVEVLLDSPDFFVMYLNQLELTAGILLGQGVLGIPAAWGLARYSFPGRRGIYRLYILWMILPFGVTMLSQYLVLERFGLMDTMWAVILPQVFSTFPVFLLYRFFREMDEAVFEAARIDGADEMQIFRYLGLPLGRTCIVSVFLLQFMDCANLIEQ